MDIVGDNEEARIVIYGPEEVGTKYLGRGRKEMSITMDYARKLGYSHYVRKVEIPEGYIKTIYDNHNKFIIINVMSGGEECEFKINTGLRVDFLDLDDDIHTRQWSSAFQFGFGQKQRDEDEPPLPEKTGELKYSYYDDILEEDDDDDTVVKPIEYYSFGNRQFPEGYLSFKHTTSSSTKYHAPILIYPSITNPGELRQRAFCEIYYYGQLVGIVPDAYSGAIFNDGYFIIITNKKVTLYKFSDVTCENYKSLKVSDPFNLPNKWVKKKQELDFTRFQEYSCTTPIFYFAGFFNGNYEGYSYAVGDPEEGDVYELKCTFVRNSEETDQYLQYLEEDAYLYEHAFRINPDSKELEILEINEVPYPSLITFEYTYESVLGGMMPLLCPGIPEGNKFLNFKKDVLAEWEGEIPVFSDYDSNGNVQYVSLVGYNKHNYNNFVGPSGAITIGGSGSAKEIMVWELQLIFQMPDSIRGHSANTFTDSDGKVTYIFNQEQTYTTHYTDVQYDECEVGEVTESCTACNKKNITYNTPYDLPEYENVLTTSLPIYINMDMLFNTLIEDQVFELNDTISALAGETEELDIPVNPNYGTGSSYKMSFTPYVFSNPTDLYKPDPNPTVTNSTNQSKFSLYTVFEIMFGSKIKITSPFASHNPFMGPKINENSFDYAFKAPFYTPFIFSYSWYFTNYFVSKYVNVVIIDVQDPDGGNLPIDEILRIPVVMQGGALMEPSSQVYYETHPEEFFDKAEVCEIKYPFELIYPVNPLWHPYYKWIPNCA